LIGRQEEKTLIAAALQELSRGAPHQTLVLQGEAGIGKSRLFEDLIRQAETLDVKMFVGNGDAIEKASPYHAWRPIFDQIFEIEDSSAQGDLMEEPRGSIEANVLAKLAEIDPDLVRYAPLVDVVLPISIPDNELTSAMSGETRGGNVRELLTRLLAFEASQSPTLIVMEDMHWFDSASWALLVDVQQKVRPLFLALNTRPLADPVPAQFKQLLDTPGTRLLRLEAMKLDDVEALVCQRLGVKSVPPMLSRLIREKSEGHPFFAEELAYALRDSGILAIENQECRIHSRFLNFEDLTLPDTLQAAITNRIDSLNPSQQLTLKVASVIGRIFAFRVLQAIHPIEADKSSLSDYMVTLTRLSLTLVESEGPDLAYIFKHVVTQEVAYNLMLFSQRRLLHQAVAEWIEKNHEKNLEAYYALLAHHWSQAADTSEAVRDEHALYKSVEYLEKAGEQAMQNYANQEAVHFFRQALEMDARITGLEVGKIARDHQLRKARWHSRLALAHYGLGSLPDCNKHVHEALRLLESPMPRSTLQIGLGLVPQLIRQGFHRAFPSRFIGSAIDPQKRDAAIEAARLYELLGRIFFYSNETLPIMYSVVRFLNEAETAGPSPELASAYASTAVLAGFAQVHKLAETYVNRALAVAREVNLPSNLITVYVVTSAYLLTVGKWEAVRHRVEEAKAICEQLGDDRQWGDATAMLGESAFIAGDTSYSMRMQKELLEDARRRRNPLHQCWGLLGVSVNNIRWGKAADALPMLEEALRILEETPNLASSIEITGQLALAQLRLGQEEKALAYAEKVLKLSEKLSPTVYSMDVGFSGAADVYFELWQKALQDSARKADSDRLRALAERAIKLLVAFEKVFPIGKAVTPIYQGWYEWLTGQYEAANKTLQRGLEAAVKFNMAYEEGLIRLKLATYSKENLDVRKRNLWRAMEIFEKMGALNELRATQEEAQKAGV
jgi:tetratricopeptide (TPR) repeat protein